MAKVLVLLVAGEAYALPLEAVREVVAGAPTRRLPSAPAPWVTGVASVRGELMPVVDLAARLGATGGAEEVLVVVDHDDRTAALAVETVLRLADVPDDLPPAPAYAGDAAAAIAELSGELVVVLRPQALLPPG